jgi:hypothetical protein
MVRSMWALGLGASAHADNRSTILGHRNVSEAAERVHPLNVREVRL